MAIDHGRKADGKWSFQDRAHVEDFACLLPKALHELYFQRLRGLAVGIIVRAV
jgi:hypothetical protein